jgi:tRNA nucleotidyltransferase (CCA-adding enzyme)
MSRRQPCPLSQNPLGYTINRMEMKPTKTTPLLSCQNARLVEVAREFAQAVRNLPRPLLRKEGGADTLPLAKGELEGVQGPRAFLVGGFVRDALMGIPSKDLDMEMYGVSPADLMALAERLYPRQVNTVGESFGILKVRIDHEYDFDISIPRRESKNGKGHKGFLVESDPNMGFEEACKRRDFTINAMLMDPLTEEIIDPFGGQKDLQQNILRVTDEERFQDDPLRVYRAVQFAARFDVAIDWASGKIMKQMVERGDLSELSPERVTDEIKKLLLKSGKPSIGFELMDELGIIQRHYPELHILKDTPQEPEWHPEGDVWIHTLMVVDEAAKIIRRDHGGLYNDEEKLGIMLGALCHDLGKPSTTAIGEKNGTPRIRSLGHEEAGVEPTKALCKKWTFGERVEQAAVAIAREHLKPGMLYLEKEKKVLNDEQYVNAIRKLIKRIHPVSWRVLLASAEADFRGRTLPDAQTTPFIYGETFEKAIQEHGLDQEPTKPLILGRDLIARGLKPGPDMGTIIAEAEALRDEGKIHTRKEALAWLEDYLKKMK